MTTDLDFDEPIGEYPDLPRSGFVAHLAAAAEVANLRSEVQRWRQVSEDIVDATTPEQLADYLIVSGLSINIGPYGEWGQQTLQMLLAELGFDPGMGMPDAGKLADERTNLRAAISEIRAMHPRSDTTTGFGPTPRCNRCLCEYPCPHIVALERRGL